MWIYRIQSPSVPADLIKARVGSALGVKVGVAAEVDVLVAPRVGVDARVGGDGLVGVKASVGVDGFVGVKGSAGVELLVEAGVGAGPQAENTKHEKRNTVFRICFIFMGSSPIAGAPAGGSIRLPNP